MLIPSERASQARVAAQPGSSDLERASYAGAVASLSPPARHSVARSLVNRLRLFGGAVLDAESGPVTGRATQRHRLALLALLATTRRRHRGRDQLVSVLWPDADAERGRRLLSDSIYRINQALGGEVLSGIGDESPSTASSSAATSPTSRRRWRRATGGARPRCTPVPSSTASICPTRASSTSGWRASARITRDRRRRRRGARGEARGAGRNAEPSSGGSVSPRWCPTTRAWRWS